MEGTVWTVRESHVGHSVDCEGESWRAQCGL